MLEPLAAIEEIAKEDMAAALKLLEQETAHVRRAMGHESVSLEEYADTALAISRDFIYITSRQRYDRNNSASNTDRLASIKVCTSSSSSSVVLHHLKLHFSTSEFGVGVVQELSTACVGAFWDCVKGKWLLLVKCTG